MTEDVPLAKLVASVALRAATAAGMGLAGAVAVADCALANFSRISALFLLLSASTSSGDSSVVSGISSMTSGSTFLGGSAATTLRTGDGARRWSL